MKQNEHTNKETETSSVCDVDCKKMMEKVKL